MSQGLCPSCGAAVNMAAGQDEINCTYCGTLVKRPEAEAQFAEVKNSKFGGTLLIAETAQEGGSYEEALNYYNKVIEQEPTFADAWLNKGICMVRSSKIGDLKIPEAISSWRAAIKFAKNPDAMRKRVSLEINNVVSDFYPVLESHFREFRSTTNAHEEHARRFDLLESALALALDLNPTSKTIAENGIYLCDRFVKSVRTTNFKSDNGWETGERLAEVIAAPIQRTKVKYEQALWRNPKFMVEYEARLKALGITSEVAELIFKGDRFAALKAHAKVYRQELTQEQFAERGPELAEAFKRAEAALKAEYPERFSVPPPKSGCFVATACYGDYDHPIVLELRRFRDGCLETSPTGRAFIRLYYKCSPPFANFIGKNTVLKTLARTLIVAPALALARIAKRIEL